MITLVSLVSPIRLVVPLAPLNQSSRCLYSNSFYFILISLLSSCEDHLLLVIVVWHTSGIDLLLVVEMRPLLRPHDLGIVMRAMTICTLLARSVLALGMGTGWLVDQLVARTAWASHL